MYSVELYRRLQRRRARRSAGPRAAASSSRRARERLAGDPAPDQLGAHLRPAAARDLAGRGAGAVPADRHRRRGRRGLPGLRRLPRPVAAVLRAGRTWPGRAGVRIVERTRVLGIDVRDGRVRAVRTDRGDIDCEVVVNCGGMFAAEIGRLAGVRVPIVPMSHQYLITEPFLPRRDTPLPTLRDPDLLVYFRQEVDGLVMGGYERNPAPWTATPTRYDAIPADFNGRLLPEDWARMEEIAQNSAAAGAGDGRHRRPQGHQRPGGVHPRQRVLPGRDRGGRAVRRGRVLRARHRRRRRHRPGDGRVDRRRRAELRRVAHGHQPVRPRSTARPATRSRGRSRTTRPTTTSRIPDCSAAPGRPLRMSPAYGWHAGARRAVRREGRLGTRRLVRAQRRGRRRVAAAGRLGRAVLVAGDRAPSTCGTRAAAGLFDESSFAKIEVSGPDAADLLRLGLRQRRRPRDRRGHLHPGAQPPRRHRGRLHRHPHRRRTCS